MPRRTPVRRCWRSSRHDFSAQSRCWGRHSVRRLGVGTGLVPIKTPQGQAELVARERRVSQRHRTVLFLIDGKRSADEVRAMALKAGVPESAFGELIELGMIMLSEPSFSESTSSARLDS